MFKIQVIKYVPLTILALLALAGCEKPPPELKIEEDYAVWSPDGSTIAYYRHPTEGPSGGIWLIDTDGTNDRLFIEGIQADWSPDGKRLAIATAGWCIFLIDKDSSNFEWLIRDGESNSPAWSPDGKWIAFVRPFAPGGLFWVNTETKDSGSITNGGGGGWSPDSKQIVYFYGEDQGRKGLIRVVNIEDSSCKTVITFDAYEDGPLSGIPRWSPDGEKILFTMDLHTWVIDTSGENLECLAEYAVYPNWSPDGRKIVFTKCDEDGRLWIMDSDGKNQRPLREE